MIRTVIAATALAMLAGCAATQLSRSVSFDGATYHMVAGTQLRATFRGNKIRYPNPYRIGDIVLTSSVRCDGFYPDGRYISCGHRPNRREGTYEFVNDRVCVTVSGPSRCYQLYRSRAGEYLLGHPGEDPLLEPISFVPAADDTVPPPMP